MTLIFILLAWTTLSLAAPAGVYTLPARLWAMQAAMPPGTNEPMPIPSSESMRFARPAGVVVSGELAPGVPMPGAQSGSGGPIGADGRMPGLPPGVPLGPPGPGSSTPSVPQQLENAPPSSQVTPIAVTRTPAAPRPLPCEVRLGLARTDLPYSGGEFTIPAVVTPATCRPKVVFGPSWMRVVDPTAFRLIADPNTSTIARDAIVMIGDTSFFVRQEPPAQPGLAAAPGRLVFGVDKQGRTDTKTVTAWTEYGTGAITAKPGDPWLTVKPRPGKNKHQAYDVTVQREAKLGPGRHDTYIELAPEGSGPPLRIPVVVEVTGAF